MPAISDYWVDNFRYTYFRKIERLANLLKKFTVGCWLIGLFQLNINAIWAAMITTIGLLLIEIGIDFIKVKS
jgi:hypothetical protein